MRRLMSVALPIVVAGALIAGCGGDKKTVKIPGGGEVSVSDKLPSSFPGDFPVYKGSKVKGSLSGSSNGISGTTVTWETGDSVEKVTAFFDEELQKDAWKSNSNGNLNESSYWSGENKDGSKAFYAFASKADDKTSIVVTIGDNENGSSGDSKTSTSSGGSTSGNNKTATAEAEDNGGDSSGDSSNSKSPTPSALPPEVKLDKSFPADRVPLPSGARVTSSSSFGSGTSKTFIITFFTKDDPEKVASYFSDEMPKHGWSDSFSSNSNGDYFVTFTSGDSSSGSNDGLTVSATPSTDTPGYTEVSVSVSTQAPGG